MGTPTEKQRIGALGEAIAAKFLVKHGFVVITRNYLKKYGEIDIISQKDGILHFAEVKTVSRENVLRETADTWRPEDNIHQAKLKRLGRTIQAYLFEYHVSKDWQFDVITVELYKETKTARVKFLPDLVL